MTSRAVLVGAAILLFQIGCGEQAPSGPTQERTSATATAQVPSAVGVEAVSAMGGVPAELQDLFRRLPAEWQSRFQSLPPERQQRIVATIQQLPKDRLQRLAERAATLGGPRAELRPAATRSALPMGEIPAGEPRGVPPGWTGVTAGTTVDNHPPNAVFRTRPAANNGRIEGRGPVTFNMCESTDPDLGDQLKFKADFHGTGELVLVHCRNTVEYPELSWYNNVTLCVSDRQPIPGHEICQSYDVHVWPGSHGQCRVVNSGSYTNDNATNFFPTGFFDIARDQGLVLGVSATGTSLGSPPGVPGFAAFTAGACLPPPAPFRVYVTLYGNGSAVGSGAAPQDYTGCYAYGYETDYDDLRFGPTPPTRTVSWKTEVCDPGSF